MRARAPWKVPQLKAAFKIIGIEAGEIEFDAHISREL